MLQSDGFNGKGGKGDYGWLQGEVHGTYQNFVMIISINLNT